ncbi:hypothetical protein AB0392_06660 [Nonomuraea angiospora]|uniref:hypothetical protein n=1 Tax=Nonomuraea angiospora TaxID=46172 RepID=UPI00344FF1F7
MDEATARTFEKLTMHARQADDIYGPATLLPVVNGHRAALGQVLAREQMPFLLRNRLLSAYTQMSQLAGYLAYDLLDYAAAEDTLNDGLRWALDLGDPTLISYLHFWLGRVAADQQRTTTVLDHAFAGQGDSRGSLQAYGGRRHRLTAQFGPPDRPAHKSARPAGSLGGQRSRSPPGRDPACSGIAVNPGPPGFTTSTAGG